MSSRELARVFIQLLGLAMLVQLLGTLLDLIAAFLRTDVGLGRALRDLGAPMAVFLGIIWLFLRHASWIAATLRIGSDVPGEAIRADATWTPDSARRVGCILLGIYAALPTIDPIVEWIRRRSTPDAPVAPWSASPAPIFEIAIRFVVAFVLIVGPRRVFSFLRWFTASPSRGGAGEGA